MKKFQKGILFLLISCLILPVAMLFSACSSPKSPASSNRILSLSVNPKMVFVVDKDNKISSISYDGNEDSGKIFANVDFVGMNIEVALKIFVENATISGHIGLTDEATTNDFIIEVSGSVEEDIESLKNLAKSKVEEVLTDFGVELTVGIRDLDENKMKADLVEKAKKLYLERKETDLKNMSNEELINTAKAFLSSVSDKGFLILPVRFLIVFSS